MAETSESLGGKRPIPFTVDGQPFTTSNPRLTAAEILRLAGLDPEQFDLGELEDKEPPETKRHANDEIIVIRKDERFVSIRRSADVA